MSAPRRGRSPPPQFDDDDSSILPVGARTPPLHFSPCGADKTPDAPNRVLYTYSRHYSIIPDRLAIFEQ